MSSLTSVTKKSLETTKLPKSVLTAVHKLMTNEFKVQVVYFILVNVQQQNVVGATLKHRASWVSLQPPHGREDSLTCRICSWHHQYVQGESVSTPH